MRAHGGSGLSSVGGRPPNGAVPIWDGRRRAFFRAPPSVPDRHRSTRLARPDCPELLPASPPIGHALKLELQHQWYYGLEKLQKDSLNNGGRSQYLWPATGSDSGTEKAPGGLYTGQDPAIAPGALLAIPAAVASAVNTSTVAGGRIKQVRFSAPSPLHPPCTPPAPPLHLACTSPAPRLHLPCIRPPGTRVGDM